MFRPLLMSKSRVCPRLCVGPCSMLNQVTVVLNVIISFEILIFCIIDVNIKIPCNSKTVKIIDNSSVNSSTKAGENAWSTFQHNA